LFGIFLLPGSPQVRFQHINQFLCGPGSIGCGVLVGVYHVKADVPVEDLGHQRIDRAAAGRNRVEDVRTICLAFDRVLDGLYLSPNSPDAIEDLFLISEYVSQKSTSTEL
jgi:hypothetical protein